MSNKRQGTILIAAGGTGGHLYPAIAVADEIRRQRPETKVIFVGTRDRIESREVPRAGYPFFPIAVEPPRRSPIALAVYPFVFASATLDAFRLIGAERVDAMLGGGAYLSVPVGIAAAMRRKPIALLEINSVVGTANKMLSHVASKIFLAYPESRSQFNAAASGKLAVSGTPVRAGLGASNLSREAARQHFGLDPNRQTILCFGGSLGARTLNEAVGRYARQLAERGVNLLWQTGKSVKLEELRATFQDLPNVRVVDYIYDMEHAYAAADLVVCRAGASSLAELARLGKPAVLVPWSLAAADHQVANARAFERAGAAEVLTDQDVGGRLFTVVDELRQDAQRLAAMSEAMKRRDEARAAAIVAEWLIGRIS